MRLILASTSPRRREILGLLGLPFEVIAPNFQELSSSKLAIEEEVLNFAAGKARSVARNNAASIVIGSDTMIGIDLHKIGKPADLSGARQMLRTLSGRWHRILTSVAIVDGLGGPGLSTVEKVDVKMRDFSEAEIEQYIARNESLDKAGGYSIQGEGRRLIEIIRGDYLAAVGLPLMPIVAYLKNRGLRLPVRIDGLYAGKSFLNWRSF